MIASADAGPPRCSTPRAGAPQVVCWPRARLGLRCRENRHGYPQRCQGHTSPEASTSPHVAVGAKARALAVLGPAAAANGWAESPRLEVALASGTAGVQENLQLQ